MMMPKTLKFWVLLTLITLSALAPLFTTNLMIIWFLMEINNFTFLTHMSTHMKNKKMIFLYFFIQALASFMLIISILMVSPHHSTALVNVLLFSSLSLKLGIPPLHSWFPLVSLYMPWDTIIILFSIQKIIPMIIITYTNPHPIIIVSLIMGSMLIPPYSMMNKTNFKDLLTYSSINHSGWMLAVAYMFPATWVLYWTLYFLTLLTLINSIKTYKIHFMFKKKLTQLLKPMPMFLMMSMAGMPPLSMFIMKWFTILTLIIHSKTIMVLTMIMLFSSLFTMFIYINMVMKISMNSMSEPKLMSSSSYILWWTHHSLIITILISLILIMI